MISILLLWANYLACVLFLCTATAAKLLQSCPTLQSHGQQPTKLPRFWDSPGKNPGMGCHFLHQCMRVKSEIGVAQSCPTLWIPMDCGLPGSSVCGIDVFLKLPCFFHDPMDISNLVPLPFLKSAWTSGSSWFTYYRSLARRILSISLLVCEMSAIVR